AVRRDVLEARGLALDVLARPVLADEDPAPRALGDGGGTAENAVKVGLVDELQGAALEVLVVGGVPPDLTLAGVAPVRGREVTAALREGAALEPEELRAALV